MTAPLLFYRTLEILMGSDDLAELVRELERYLYTYRAETKA